MAEENNPQEAESNQAPKTASFALQRVYLKDLSFESPAGIASLQKQWQPKIEQDINTSANKVGEQTYEVVLKITVNAIMDGKTAFLVEVQQAGLFQINIEGPQLAQIFNTLCAQTLFPYAREAVDNVIVKGGFPALNMPPINFDALFAQAIREARANAEAKSADAPANAE